MKPVEASRVKEIKFSAIRAIAQLVEDLRKEGKKVIDLSLGRPDFDTPVHIKEAAKKALDEGKVHYTSNYGIIELRQALAQKLHRENGLLYRPEEIIITIGAVEALTTALMAFLEPGDEVIIPEPSWVNYSSIVRLCGGTPVFVSMVQRDGFSLQPSKIIEKLSAKTKAMMFATPNNPTGSVLSSEVLSPLAKIALDHNLLVIADEVYEKIIYDGIKHISMASLPGMKERTITCNAFSKTYSMTGWRLGYLVADQGLMSSLIKVHQNLVTSANSIAQWAALEAITGPQQCVEEMVEEFGRRRTFLKEAFKDLSPLRLINPEGAFYGFVDIRGLKMTSVEAVEFFIRNAGVAMVPGDSFGQSGEGFIRLSFATSMSNLMEAMEMIRKALKQRSQDEAEILIK
jgi:aminotransferase